MSNQTAPTWATSKDAVPDGWTQITVYEEATGERIATVYNEAAATLVEAAPKLLEALKELTDWMKSNGLHQTQPAGSGIFRTKPVEYSIYTDAIAAIAKAERLRQTA